MKAWKKEIFTIPNLLSLFRLLLIPLYVTLYLHAQKFWDYVFSASILAVSCLTDMIDGKIARKFNMVSNLGIILDPVADKATQGTLMICLAIEHPVLWALMVLFAVKESFQIFAGWMCMRKGKMMKGALFSGKLCTVVLFLSLIILVLLHNLITPVVVYVITAIDGVFMTIAFVHYVIAYTKRVPMIQDING